jgi:site-specific DNA recombinase
VLCEICERRMHGKTPKSTPYYACEPDMRHHKDRRDWYAKHPKSLWIREDDLLDIVHECFADGVFGPHRLPALRSQLSDKTPKDDTSVKRVRKEILDLDKRQNNVLAQIEEQVPSGDDEIDRDFRERLQRRYASWHACVSRRPRS